MRTFFEQLKTSCWKTSKSRYEAACRMRRCAAMSTLCIAMLSLEIIVINLLQFIPGAKGKDMPLISALTICLSVFALVLSVIVNNLDYGSREKNFHSCGLRLGDLCKRMEARLKDKNDIKLCEANHYIEEYNSILTESNQNHTTVDSLWALRNDPETKKKSNSDTNPVPYLWFRFRLWLRWNLCQTDMVYILLTVAGAACVAWAAVKSFDF